MLTPRQDDDDDDVHMTTGEWATAIAIVAAIIAAAHFIARFVPLPA